MARAKVFKRRGKVLSRSGLERSIRSGLDRDGVPYEYEPEAFKFPLPEPGHFCRQCKATDICRHTKYTPDFRLYGSSKKPVYIEGKGRFTGSNRRRMLAFKAEYPNVDLRLVFQRDNTLSKTSKTKYSQWCKDNGFPYHVGPEVPKDWLR